MRPLEEMPTPKWWVDMLREKIAAGGHGEKARLTRAIGASHQSAINAILDRDNRTSIYVGRISDHYEMPLPVVTLTKPQQAELIELSGHLDDEDLEFIKKTIRRLTRTK